MLAFAAFLLCVFVAGGVLMDWPVWVAVVGVSAFGVVSCRMMMVGLCVGDSGVKIRLATSTVSFSWSAVLSVRSQKVLVSGGGPSLPLIVRRVEFSVGPAT